MDEIDQRLISLLRQNARMNIAELSYKLGVSRGTVNNRLRKLEDSQVIVGYTVKLRPEHEPERIKAWMGVLVEGNTTRQVIANLLGEPGVVALHDTNGRWDLLAEIEASSMKGLSDVLERIRRRPADAEGATRRSEARARNARRAGLPSSTGGSPAVTTPTCP